MAYLGTKPANQVIDSTLIADGTVTTADIASGVTINFADGSASAPSITNDGDTNTGIFFPAADTIAFAEGGVEVARFDSNGNLGVGTSSPDSSNKLQVTGDIGLTWATDKFIGMKFGSGGSYKMGLMLKDSSRECKVWSQSVDSDDKITFYTGSTPSERMRIDSSGRLLVNLTSLPTSSSRLNVGFNNNSGTYGLNIYHTSSSYSDSAIVFYGHSNQTMGYIYCNGTTTQYGTSSDYRLKENIAPMTGALAKVSALKPVTYTWKSTGEASQGFIAHELQEVVPDAVYGEKDAVNEDGSIKPQGIDTSFLVATLTAAIQEQQAIINDLKTRIEALEQA